MTFYHCTLCADILLANGWFYHSFYGCKTSVLEGTGKNQLSRKKQFMNMRLFQNFCEAIFSTRHLLFDLISKCLLNFSLYSTLRCNCSSSWKVPLFHWCSVVPLVFRRCSVFRCSWFYSMPFIFCSIWKNNINRRI